MLFGNRQRLSTERETLILPCFFAATSSGPDYVLAQRFSTNFIVSATNQIQYSGFPGYEFGLPVISGSGSSNTSISVDRAVQLLVWKPGKFLVFLPLTPNWSVVLATPGADGTCVDTETPKFGFDEISGCIVNTVSNCTSLRTDVETTQMLLLEANRVARFGNPEDSNTESDWIDVISRYLFLFIVKFVTSINTS